MKINTDFLVSIIRGRDGAVASPTSDGASGSEAGKTSPSSLSTRTLFDEIYTKNGLENVKFWFLEHIQSSKNPVMNEPSFVAFLRNLTDFNEWEILEVFDMFDRDGSGIKYEEWFLILSAYTAKECKRTTKFLYKHGSSIFKHLVDPTSTRPLTFERFTRLGFLLGIPEADILYTLQFFNIQKSDVHKITIDDFNIYYFAILNKLDGGIDVTDHLRAENVQQQSNASASSSGAKQNEKCVVS